MTATDIALSLDASEMAILPEMPSVADLLASDESCRTQLLPEIVHRASAMAKGAVGTVAGSPLPSWWTSDPFITMRSVNLFKIHGAHYFPEFGVLIDRKGRALRSSMSQAAYLTPDLLLLPHMRKVGGEIVFSPPGTIATLSNVAITMPWGALHNYGHFVLDCLPPIPCILGIDSLRAYDFAFPMLKQWHRDHLDLLGVIPTELPHGCYYAETAIFTDCMDSFLLAANRNLQLVSDMQRSALGCSEGGSRKIYVSRRGNPKRVFLSEKKLEAALRDRGFEIVRPETLPVREQIALFAGSAVIVGCAGATLTNTLYCSLGAVIVEIKPRLMNQTWTRDICVMKGLKWAPYFCDSRPPDEAVVHGGEVRPQVGISFDIDLDDFLAYLDTVTGSQNWSHRLSSGAASRSHSLSLLQCLRRILLPK